MLRLLSLIHISPEGSSYDKKSLVVMKEPEETSVEFAMNKEYIRLKSDALQVEVNSDVYKRQDGNRGE